VNQRKEAPDLPYLRESGAEVINEMEWAQKCVILAKIELIHKKNKDLDWYNSAIELRILAQARAFYVNQR